MTAAHRSVLRIRFGIGITFLLLAVGCSDTNAPTTGGLNVSVTTTGGDLDLDGYLVTVDGAGPQPVAASGQVALLGLATGSHAIELSGVAINCTVTGGTSRSITIIGGETAELSFAVACVATGVQIIVATTGVDIDPDGYAVAVDGAAPVTVAVNGTVNITRLSAGSHTVVLTDVVTNCPVGGQNPRTVTIAMGEVAPVGFPVTCLATTGSIAISTATTGMDLDANGYTVQVDNATPRTLAVNATTTFEGLSAGDHSITLDGTAANCTAAGDNPRTVSVTTGRVTRDTARTTFQVSCVATTGVIEVTSATSGLDLDANGYTVQVDGSAPRALGVEGTTAFEDLSAGEHSVTLAGAAANCTAAGSNPRTVAVTTGGVTRDTARTTFAISCTAVTGVIEVTSVTSGVNLDQNGYVVSLNSATVQPLATNGVVRFGGVSGGNHQVALADAAPNCPVSGENPRTLSVTTGGLTRDTARTTFDVVCQPATGTAQIITTTTGTDLDQNGYFMGVDCDSYYGCYWSYHTEQMTVNDTVTLSGVPTGHHTFQLDDVAVNCVVGGANPRSVHVAGGTTTDVVFAVTCYALGSIQVSAATTGVDPDPDGYGVTVQRPGFAKGSTIPTNGSGTISGLLPGDYGVTLSGVSANCDVAGANPRTVTVVGGGTASILYDVACAQAARLALSLTVNGNTDIHAVNVNGTGLTRLTTAPAYDHGPAWSPNGAKLAFWSARDGNDEIYVMNQDGLGVERLTNHPNVDFRPRWSPDGAKIAFVSTRDGNFEIYVMDAGGTNLTRLTQHAGTDADPVWSPDGSKIAFWSDRESNGDIYVMSANGSGVTRLTTNNVLDIQPEWSPDGTKLVFSRLTGCDYYSSFCDYDLHVMNANGSGEVPLMTGSSDTDAAWSPDGRWIAFTASVCESYYYGCYNIYKAVHVVRPDGTRLVEVLRDAFYPAWRRP